jgi:hypothetical protein
MPPLCLLQRPKRVLGREQMDGFFSRLLDDAAKRVATQDKLQVRDIRRVRVGGREDRVSWL